MSDFYGKKIGFFSEMDFTGEVPRDKEDCRVGFAHMVVLKSRHYPLLKIKKCQESFDHVVLIIGKSMAFQKKLKKLDVIKEARRVGKKVWVRQEGPHWTYQDYPIETQLRYLELLSQVDGVLCHNQKDMAYFRGLLGEAKDIRWFPSCMILDMISSCVSNEKQEKVMIGGNFVRWYAGMDSYTVAKAMGVPIYVPSMGRKQKNEEMISDLIYLPYMNWAQWIRTLSEFRYGVHLMPTFAAGTFAMNCGYLGIPCIGYEEVDTQRLLHPELSVSYGDLAKAKALGERLVEDKRFWQDCSRYASEKYSDYFSEQQFERAAQDIFCGKSELL